MAFEYQGFATLGVNLNRQKYGPLDISNVFLTQADLNYYLSKGTETEGVSTYWYEEKDGEVLNKVVPYPYAGQVIATVFEGEAVKVWVLSEKTDGTFETKNVGDTTTVEADISELQSSIDAINTIIGSEATDTADATGFYKAFEELKADIATNTSAIGTKAVPESSEGAGDAVEATGIYKLIEDATYDDTALVERVKTIEDDYLKSTDRGDIDEAIATAAKDAENAAVKRVLTGDDTGAVAEAYDTIKEIADWIENDESGAAKLTTDVEALNNDVATIKGDYLTSADKYNDTAIIERLDNAESQIAARTVKSADTDDFTVTDGVLAIINGKRLITSDEATKLSKLILNDDGTVTTGQKVAASDVDGLAQWITDNKETVDGLFSDADEVKLTSALQGLTLNDTAVTPNEDNIVNIPIATATALGLVKGTAAVLDDTGTIINPNTVSVTKSGEMEVNALDVSKLVQTTDEELILYGGSVSELTK